MNNINNQKKTEKEIPYIPANELFKKLYHEYDKKFILESKDISPIYGIMSLIGVDPVLQISGKDDEFSLNVLNARGVSWLKNISEFDLSFCKNIEVSQKVIKGTVERKKQEFEETKRSQQMNISRIVSVILDEFKLNQKELIGLYGAFSYDFVRQFENLPELLKPNEVPDFNLFLYDSFIKQDHFKEKTAIVLYRESQNELDDGLAELTKHLNSEVSETSYEIKEAKFDLKAEEYKDLVEIAGEYCKLGELFEVVFSNVLKAKFEGDPLALYEKYRIANPSPYLFCFDFGDEQLVGASPEMMVRCENGKVHLRPISGTAKRGQDPIEDHDNMLALLADEKERAELDMLIDLGRNDLSRACEPGIEISDYRFVEKYSKVMHTVAHLTGKLREGYTALDALIACLNAGTLTGAPKVAAMTAIEKHEKQRRGYYGGVVGYLTFAGDMDTGIIIRTAHIKDKALRFQVGATLLYDSVPENEYQETLNKASAFMDMFGASE